MKLQKGLLVAAIASLVLSAPAMGARIRDRIEKDIIESSVEEPVKEDSQKDFEETREEYTVIEKKIGWTTSRLNIRKHPNASSKILGTYDFNVLVVYYEYDEDWVKVDFEDGFAYVSSKYLADEQLSYIDYDAPSNNGFKSYMPYKAITSKSSPQYKLQKIAYTGKYGIRQVDGRYCVALGSYYTKEIGQYFDLILENGTVIPCILADQKADHDTDSSNRKTLHNGCVAEFVVETSSLNKNAKRDGDISSCCEEWDSPVSKIRVYK